MKITIKVLIIIVICTCGLTLKCLAHHGGEVSINGPGISGPIITIPARTLPKKKFFIGTGINYTNSNEFTNIELTRLDKRSEHIHNTRHFFIPSLSLGYGLTDNVFFGLSVPYIFKYDIRTSFNGMAIEQGNSIGIGDITFLSEYRFLKKENIDLHSAIITGVKIPSGVRRVKDDQGLLFEADDQPGTGSWEPFVGLALSKGFKHLSLDANGLYRFSTRGTKDIIVGDMVSFNIAVSHRVTDRYLKKIFIEKLSNKTLDWDLILEANGHWSEKPGFNINLPFGHTSFRDENHGGLLIYLTPGIRVIFDKKWVSNFAVSFSTIEYLNGRQRAPSVRLVFGLTRIF